MDVVGDRRNVVIPVVQRRAGEEGKGVFSMQAEILIPDREVERRMRWDAFLDTYSVYLRDPTPLNAAQLHLAGLALEKCEKRFSAADFEAEHLGWNLAAI